MEYIKISRKELNQKIGTWFSPEITKEELLKRCDKQLDLYNTWILNLTDLRKEVEKEVRAQKEVELKKLLKSMSKEEVIKLMEEDKE